MFRLALACAEEADDWHLRAKVLMCMADQAIWCGDLDGGLTLTGLAMLRPDGLTPNARAQAFSTRARALAKLRRVEETMTAIGRADGEMAHASSANDPTAYDAIKHAGTTGDALYDLALGGRFVTEAGATTRAAGADRTTRPRHRGRGTALPDWHPARHGMTTPHAEGGHSGAPALGVQERRAELARARCDCP
ncbi:MAG: hypothetical protein ACRDQ5_07950 [Sciscionella sp.]